MKLLPESGLKRQVLFYIVFIGIVFLTMAIEMTFFLHGDRVLGLISSCNDPKVTNDAVQLIQLKIEIMLLNLLLSIGLVMLLFTKRIMIPLSNIIKATRSISDGDLSATVPIHTRDELGELSGHINDLAANYQELILLCRSMTRQARDALQDAGQECQTDRAITVLDEMDNILSEFGRNFYR